MLFHNQHRYAEIFQRRLAAFPLSPKANPSLRASVILGKQLGEALRRRSVLPSPPQNFSPRHRVPASAQTCPPLYRSALVSSEESLRSWNEAGGAREQSCPGRGVLKSISARCSGASGVSCVSSTTDSAVPADALSGLVAFFPPPRVFVHRLPPPSSFPPVGVIPLLLPPAPPLHPLTTTPTVIRAAPWLQCLWARPPLRPSGCRPARVRAARLH